LSKTHLVPSTPGAENRVLATRVPKQELGNKVNNTWGNNMIRALLFAMIACQVPRNLMAEYPPKGEPLMWLFQPKALRNELNFTTEQTTAFVKIFREYKHRIDEAQAHAFDQNKKGELSRGP
jgi:hypothetical protein